jgi:hypothetical protein
VAVKRAGLVVGVVVAFLALQGSPAVGNPGDDQWKPVVRDGFGDPRTIGVEELEAVGGRLFAATRRRTGTGPAGVWATADDGATWQPVAFEPPLPATSEAVPSLASSGDGALVAGTSDPGGGRLYLFDGSVFRALPGWSARRGVSIAPGALVTATHIYFGTQQRSGAALWRINRTTGALQRLLDFSRIDRSVDLVGAVAFFHRRLYVGTRTPGRNRSALWSSQSGAPGTWRVVAASRHGFAAVEPQRVGVKTNEHSGIAMGQFKGALYVSLDNPRNGAQMVRTSDGRHWQVVAVTGVEHPTTRAFVGMQQFEGDLWVGTITRPPAGTSIWEVTVTRGMPIPDPGAALFGEMNLPGFGDVFNRGGSPDLAVLDDALWWGGANARTGAQIWRLAASDLRRATATGPGLTIATDPVRLSPTRRLSIRATCPADDPYGCEGALEVRTARRFGSGRQRQRRLLAEQYYEMGAGETRTFALRVLGAELPFVRAHLPLLLDVQAVAFDNAYNRRATILLTR